MNQRVLEIGLRTGSWPTPSGRNYLDNINQKIKERFICYMDSNEMNKAKTILGGWLSQTHTQGVGSIMLYKYTRKTHKMYKIY
jgi:hypothetical protein